MHDGTQFASPRSVVLADCSFYHSMDLPGVGAVTGEWDLRGRVDEYLGGVQFGGRYPGGGFFNSAAPVIVITKKMTPRI